MRLLAVLLILFPLNTIAAEWKPLQGIYAVTPQHYLDPATDERMDTHYRLQLKGDAAKDLFQAMKTDSKVDDCTGGQAKNLGDMQCLYFKDTESYECHFSINLNEQKIEYGVAC